MRILKAQVGGTVYLFGPFVNEAEKRRLTARIEDAWCNPFISEVEVNDPQECLGLSKGFNPVYPRRSNVRRYPRE